MPAAPAGTRRSTMVNLAVGSIQSGVVSDASRWRKHPSAGPRHGGDRGDAEAFVDRGPPRIVDAGDDVLDAEGLAGDAGDEDVGVVATGDGGDGAVGRDAGLR